MGFCQDRRGSDRDAAHVALYQGFLLDQNIEDHGVDQQIIRLYGSC